MREKRIAHLLEMIDYHADAFARIPLASLEDAGETAALVISSVLGYQVVVLLIKDGIKGPELLASKGLDNDTRGAWTPREAFVRHLWGVIESPSILECHTLDGADGGFARRFGLGESFLAVPLSSSSDHGEDRLGLVVASQPHGDYDPNVDIMAVQIIAGIVRGTISKCIATTKLLEIYEAMNREINGCKQGEEALRKACDELEQRAEARTAELIEANERLEREIEERKRAKEAVKRAHDQLEKRVEERTSELSQSNALLRREVEERKCGQEELRKINDELKNFAYIVSHDLKTPIIHILGLSAVLLEHYQEGLEDKARVCLQRIEANAHRMELLISDLLALSRLGRVVSTFRDVSSCEITRNIVSGLEDRLKENGIELVVAPNLPNIWCDGDRMSQAFQNLIGNSIKFMGDTENPRIDIGYEDSPGFHVFYVRDNGIGIDPKYHLKIFEMFHRIREIQDDEGTGLGLAIVKRVVSSHGGRVWVESEKGKGSTFYFTLPKGRLETSPAF
jgi:signal transduction histidine kinase